MKYLTAVALALSLTAAGAAYAQDAAKQQEALQHNEAYNAAMSAGNYEAALTEAVAAWQAAEAGWGDNPNTAALAMQATLAYLDLGRPLEGGQAAARTLALVGQADGAYSQADAQLWYGITNANTDPAGAQTNLQAGLAAMDAAGAVSEDTILGRLTFAALQLGTDREGALAAVQKAIADARATNSVSLRSHLFEAGKIQYLASDFAAANGVLFEAIGLWEEQPVGVIPPALASTLAWQRIAQEAMFRSMPAGDGPRGGGRGFGGGGFGFGPPAYMPTRQCTINYDRSIEATILPAVEGEQAQLGAAVVMWDLDENGQATNVRIVGSAPGAVQHEQLIIQGISNRQARRFVREPCRPGWVETVFYEY